MKFPFIAVSRLSSIQQAMKSVVREFGYPMALMCEVSQIGTTDK
jgi:hypothetical protein